MTQAPEKVKPPRLAEDIARWATPCPAARKLLQTGMMPGPYLKLLIEQHLFLDAIRFMAQALRRREAVWWAALCARDAVPDPLPEAEHEALRAAVAWVLNPTAETGRAAAVAAQKAGLKSPAGCAARAASLAGGADGPRFGKLVSTCVFLSVRRGPAARRRVAYRQAVAVGLDVDSGATGWTRPAAGPA